MIDRLSKGPATVGELGASFRITKQAVTKHVRSLEQAGLLVRSVEGRVHRCRLEPKPLQRAERWMEQRRRVWNRNLDRLERLLEKEK